ncbi:unnamed protein product [Effrenium voratum]|uniref:Uncharacterized protein n=1 Tax=Effrenium voratum TaxID=2562239 RepID=A0AA36JNB7_9DINO|nr:unnamed protein product [Effrenium voratum]
MYRVQDGHDLRLVALLKVELVALVAALPERLTSVNQPGPVNSEPFLLRSENPACSSHRLLPVFKSTLEEAPDLHLSFLGYKMKWGRWLWMALCGLSCICFLYASGLSVLDVQSPRCSDARSETLQPRELVLAEAPEGAKWPVPGPAKVLPVLGTAIRGSTSTEPQFLTFVSFEVLLGEASCSCSLQALGCGFSVAVLLTSSSGKWSVTLRHVFQREVFESQESSAVFGVSLGGGALQSLDCTGHRRCLAQTEGQARGGEDEPWGRIEVFDWSWDARFSVDENLLNLAFAVSHNCYRFNRGMKCGLYGAVLCREPILKDSIRKTMRDVTGRGFAV